MVQPECFSIILNCTEKCIIKLGGLTSPDKVIIKLTSE